METDLGFLPRAERVALGMRALYENAGYRKYAMSRFEEYSMYLDHIGFLKSPSVITFNDMDGRVMALKPDVTLSIVKNTRATAQSAEKLYYQESVFRRDRGSRSFREINQLGLECIGKLDACATCEVLCLAVDTLREIGCDYVITVSHMGLLNAVLDSLSVDCDGRASLLQCVRQKNFHGLREAAISSGIAKEDAEAVCRILTLDGDFPETLSRADALVQTRSMRDPLIELNTLYTLMKSLGAADCLRLDLSLANESEYYNGVVFQGFVRGVPQPLLTGGSYGGLMRRFGRDLDAIGFGVYLNELDLLFAKERRDGVDALILYGDGEDKAALLREAGALRKRGLSVRVERNIPDDFRYKRLLVFENGGLREVE